MNCKKCNSTWFTSPEISKRLRECPFCRAPLYQREKKTIKADMNIVRKNISSTLAYIMSEYGEKVMWNRYKLNAYIYDIAPALKKERRRIKVAFKVGAVMLLKDAYKKGSDEKNIAVAQAVSKLMNDADVAESAARETIEYFTAAFGWNISSKSKEENWAEKASEAYEKEDYTTALRFAKLAASYGNAAAQNILAECFYWGHGIPVDEVKAVEWYKKAAENGDSNAMCSLGDCYASGIGVLQNMEKARMYYEKSASMGNKRALLEL